MQDFQIGRGMVQEAVGTLGNVANLTQILPANANRTTIILSFFASGLTPIIRISNTNQINDAFLMMTDTTGLPTILTVKDWGQFVTNAIFYASGGIAANGRFASLISYGLEPGIYRKPHGGSGN